MDNSTFESLEKFLIRIPAIRSSIGKGSNKEGYWWVKFEIDLGHKYAWNVVQELAHIMNYPSTNEKPPILFYPSSPAPYLNGGPEAYLFWVIESKEISFKPEILKKLLEEKMPNPVDNLNQWILDI
ncbi:hypothetical protein [Ascidiimonas sp. W6]|uniref:hypothetical protein n=1 Tax=Ascidiimonas meishanensis TaxID=3128903 RepID=UPI0030EC748F